MIFALLGLVMLAALASQRFADVADGDGGDAAGAAAPSGQAAAPASESSSAAQPAGGAAGAAPGSAATFDARADARRILTQIKQQDQGVSPAAPARVESGEPVQPQGQINYTPQQVFAALELGEEFLGDLPPGERAVLEPKLAQLAQHWYANRWSPAAQQLRQVQAEQQQFYEQLQAFGATPAFQMAQYLASNPQVLEAVYGFLNGQTPPQGAPGQPNGWPQQTSSRGATSAPKLNPDELDEATRAIYEMAAQTGQSVQAIEQQLAETRRYLQDVHDWRGHQETAQAQYRRQLAEQSSARDTAALLESAKRHFGFDPASYKREFKEAVDLTMDHLKARGMPDDLSALFLRNLERAGFKEIKARRARQAQASAPAPPQGAAPTGESMRDDIRRALANSRREVLA